MMNLFGTDDYEVRWATGYPLHDTQTDAAFYRDDASYIGSYVCSVSRNGLSVDIHCDGDMEITNQTNGDVYRCSSDLIAAGFDEDEKIDNESEATMSGDLIWDHNPWFDMYVNGEHLDNVQYDIDEAIDQAKAWLDCEDCISSVTRTVTSNKAWLDEEKN